MFAIIKLGGTQFLVKEGDVITVNNLNKEVNSEITINDVLSKGNESNIELGHPFVEGANVTAKVIENGKAKKVIFFKKIRRHNHRRKKGFRQSITKLQITKIN